MLRKALVKYDHTRTSQPNLAPRLRKWGNYTMRKRRAARVPFPAMVGLLLAILVPTIGDTQQVKTFSIEADMDASMNPIMQHVMVQDSAPVTILECAFHDTTAWTHGNTHTLVTHGNVTLGFATGVRTAQYVVFGFRLGDYEHPIVASLGQLGRDNTDHGYYDNTGRYTFDSRNDAALDLKWEIDKKVGDPSNATIFVCGVLHATMKSGRVWSDPTAVALYHHGELIPICD